MYIYDNNRIPFFSIVLCTYNRAYILENAIQSVLNQIEADWELIIVDDGSTDDTFSICKKYVEVNNKIKYIYHKNKGLPFSRNTGIFASTGIYVTFLDSDDEYKNNHLSIRKQVLLQNPEVDFLYGFTEIIGAPYVPDKFNPQNKVHIDKCYVGGTFFVRRNELIELGGFDNIDFAEDSALATKALDKGLLLASIENRTYIYNRNLDDSICNQR